MEVLTYTQLEQVVLSCPCKSIIKILVIWNKASWQFSRKIHYLTREFHVKSNAKNRYLTNHEAMSAISVFDTGNISGIHKSGYYFSLNLIAFVLNKRKPRFINVGVNVNSRPSKAIAVESTVSNQNQRTLFQPRGRQPSFSNCLYKIYTINFRTLFLIVFRVIVLLLLQCSIIENLAFRSRNSTLNASPRPVTNQSARIL